VPAHDFVSRFQSKFVAGTYDLPQDLTAAWLRGEDLRGVRPTLPLRSVAIIRDDLGRFLGMGKVLADRLKNLLPRRVVL
jgi:NOL1/NOP2/fmu family ribosome biogenesis protein